MREKFENYRRDLGETFAFNGGKLGSKLGGKNSLEKFRGELWGEIWREKWGGNHKL